MDVQQMAALAVIDLMPVIEPVLEILGVAIAALALWGLKRLVDKLGVDIDVKRFATIDEIAMRGVQLAKRKLRDSGVTEIQTSNQLVDAAAGYVIESAPVALKHFKIDPSTEAGREKIRQMVLARLDDHPDPAPAKPAG